jgi:transcriptional regulator with XRE-family HTH domain
MALTNSERPHPVYEQIGRTIRNLRTRSDGPNLSQAQLAEAISLTRASVANIERGKQKILAHTLVEIASALGVSPASLLPAYDGALGLSPVDGTDRLCQEALSMIERAHQLVG